MKRSGRFSEPPDSEKWKLLSSPCPAFPWLFCFTKKKLPNYQGFSVPAERTKTLEKQEQRPILARKIFAAKNQPRKSKQSRKGRTGHPLPENQLLIFLTFWLIVLRTANHPDFYPPDSVCAIEISHNATYGIFIEYWDVCPQQPELQPSIRAETVTTHTSLTKGAKCWGPKKAL